MRIVAVNGRVSSGEMQEVRTATQINDLRVYEESGRFNVHSGTCRSIKPGSKDTGIGTPPTSV